MIQRIRWFFFLALVVSGVVIALQNTHDVDIDFFTWTRSQPLSVLLLASMAFGFLLGAVITGSMLRSRQKGAIAKAKAEAKAVKAEKRATEAEAALKEKMKEQPPTPPAESPKV